MLTRTCQIAALITVFQTLIPFSALAQGLVSVDFGYPFNEFTGVEPAAAAADPLFAAADQWNYVEGSAIPVLDPSYPNLVDSLGNTTSVTLSFTGRVSFWSFGDSVDPLWGDFLVRGGASGVAPVLDWEITGLAAHAEYSLYVYGSKANFIRAHDFLVDTNGDGSLVDETPQTIGSAATDFTTSTDAYFASVHSDAAGTIIGRLIAGDGGCCGPNEANWGGFQLASVETVELEVDIDIKPDGDPNPINLRSQGLIPVQILGSETFDVTEINRMTLAFGPDGAFPVHDDLGHFQASKSGPGALLSHYATQETGIEPTAEEACVTGQLTDGTPFKGCDSIVIVPACGLGFELAFLLPPLMWLHGRQRRRAA